MKRSLFSGPMALLCLFAAQTGHARVAVLLQARGEVLVRAGGAGPFRRAAESAALDFKDEILTRETGTAHVAFDNGDVVLIKPGSRFKISGRPKNILLNFSIGEFLIGLRRRLGQGESFKVKTPAAVAAVRGTLFWGLSDAQKNTTYVSLGHSIEITAKGETVVAAPGQKVAIAFGRPPSPSVPSQVAAGFLDTFSIKGSIQGLGGLLEK